MDGEKLQAWFRILNFKDFTSERGHKGNVREYDLVRYINNIIRCYQSDNYSVIPIFIEHARVYMKDHKGNEQTTAYYKMVSEFLIDMEAFINETASVTKNS